MSLKLQQEETKWEKKEKDICFRQKFAVEELHKRKHMLGSVAVHAFSISKNPPCRVWPLVLAAQKTEHLCLFLSAM